MGRVVSNPMFHLTTILWNAAATTNIDAFLMYSLQQPCEWLREVRRAHTYHFIVPMRKQRPREVRTRNPAIKWQSRARLQTPGRSDGQTSALCACRAPFTRSRGHPGEGQTRCSVSWPGRGVWFASLINTIYNLKYKSQRNSKIGVLLIVRLINDHLYSSVFRMIWVNFAWEKDTQDDLKVLFLSVNFWRRGCWEKKETKQKTFKLHSGTFSLKL